VSPAFTLSQTATSSTISSPTSDATQSSNDSKTPVGAIVGGVVGGVAGIALLGVLAWLFLRRRRSQTAELQGNAYLPYGQRAGGPAEKYAHHAEVEGHALHEIGVGLPAQMPTDRTPVELEGAGPLRK
jgi:hypothetical protein